MFDSAAKSISLFLDRLSHRLAAILQSKYFLGVALAWFILQAVLFALSIKLNLPPDESHHTLVIKYLALNDFNLWVEQTGFFGQGELEREISFLYHWLMSPLYAALSSFSHAVAVHVLRFISIGFGIGSLIMLKKIGDRLDIPKAVTHFSIFALASTLMFVFISSAVSYDNPTTFLSLASILALILLLQKFSLWRLLVLAVLVGIGSLIKQSFLPLTLMILLVVVWQIYREKGRFRKHWNDFLRRKRWPVVMLSVIVLILVGLGIERIGINLAVYKSLNPACTEFHTVAECENWDMFRRHQKFAQRDINQSKLMNLVEFTPRWGMKNVPAIYGIYAHKMLTLPSRLTMPIIIFMVFAGMAIIRKTDIRKEPLVALVLGMSLVYTGFVMYYNYSTPYSNTGVFGHALQGRYLFPVLPLLYLIGFYSIYKWVPRLWPYLFVLVMIPLVLASAPSLFALTGPEWYTALGETLFHYSETARLLSEWTLWIIK